MLPVGLVYRRLSPASGQCYLTFDDGPDPDWTPALLAVLAQARVTATFFVVGRLARAHAPLLRAASAAGHAIGCHSFTHRHPWLLSRARARREVFDGADAVADMLGERPLWYRPPHGRLSRAVCEAVDEAGQRVALWSVSAIDWGPFAAPDRIRARLGAVGAGDIVLLHDGPMRHNRPDRTLQVLPDVLAGLVQHGPVPARLPATVTMEA
jgi:peptidoglycan/xylan/chitin deacetylase (PgdA/CDA1 family)